MRKNYRIFSLLILLAVIVDKIITEANRCGKKYGSGPNDECCYGWCGTSDEYCGYKCQVEYGRCNLELSTSSNKEKNVITSSSSSSSNTLSGIDSV